MSTPTEDRIGRRYTYRWDGGFSETEKYNRQPMTILSEARDYDKEEVGFMYRVRFEDGTEQDVYEDEIGVFLP